MLDRKCWPVLAAEGVLLVGPAGEPPPVSDDEQAAAVRDGRWTVASPVVPDRLSSDADR